MQIFVEYMCAASSPGKLLVDVLVGGVERRGVAAAWTDRHEVEVNDASFAGGFGVLRTDADFQ